MDRPRATPAAWTPRDPAWQERVRESFARQTIMKTIGAGLVRVAPGEVDIELPFRDDLCQQHGFLHAGVVTAIADSACGYAALSLMPPSAAVLTVEFKVNLLTPARGDRFVARGRVVRPGRTLTVCSADVVAVGDGRERPVAAMLTTMMAVEERPDVPAGL
ncbi:MAG: PaaI family thioesterase [Candidatus Rokubacteria bacterium]|nr:PaaI family thioesterase [Candidatus Rokubacteria bacterium]